MSLKFFLLEFSSKRRKEKSVLIGAWDKVRRWSRVPVKIIPHKVDFVTKVKWKSGTRLYYIFFNKGLLLMALGKLDGQD